MYRKFYTRGIRKKGLKITPRLKRLLKEELREDIGIDDTTSDLFVSKNQFGVAHIIAKRRGILCGVDVVKAIYSLVDPDVKMKVRMQDGQLLRKGQKIIMVEGPLKSILKGERVSLNFLGQLSGIASLTNQFVNRIHDIRARIYDTRKTTPLWRALEKHAVRSGGGFNHRFGLYDQILVKENHWLFIQDDKILKKKIEQAKKKMFTEVEVRNLNELKRILPCRPDAILLDNFNIQNIKRAVQITKKCKPAPALEVSGGVSLSNIRKFAKTGVDRISIGALTHSAPVFDFSLIVTKVCEKKFEL